MTTDKKLVSQRFLPVAEPALIGNEKQYVMDCLDSGWISSVGEYVSRFEAELARVFEVEHAIVCCNGTVALHLALLALGLGPGDEVLVPSLTFVASANAVAYTGATPVFVDCDRDSWLISLDAVRRAITPQTRAIMPVHLFGHPAPMDELRALASEHGLVIVEDAAEAHGATYKGKSVGGLGEIGTFSFYGNKIITTGEGGAVVTNDRALAEKARLLRGQGQDPTRRYWFIEMGYNYRMTNIQAAIGLAQLEKMDWHLARHRETAGWYKELLTERLPTIQQQVEQPWARNAYWLNSFVLPEDFPFDRDETMRRLHARGIESRPFFYPLHTLPIYQGQNRFPQPNTESLAARGLSLPSSALLTRSDVEYIVESLAAIRDE